jgi:hypothetical protein
MNSTPIKHKNRNRALRQEVLQKQLNGFYAEKANFDILYDCVNQHSGVSLRALEFLCTKMAPQQGVLIESKNGELVDLNSKYLAWISSNRKGMFDFFRRNKKSRVEYSRHGKTVITTLAQMRFFVFAIKNGVYEYARKRLNDIDKQMADVLSKEREQRRKPKKRAAPEDDSTAVEQQQPPKKKRRRAQSGKKSIPCASTKPVVLSFQHHAKNS